MPTGQVYKKECKNQNQIFSDHFNTPSLIRTIPSVLEFHQINHFHGSWTSRPRTVTADREFHPALKTLLLFNYLPKYTTEKNFLQPEFAGRIVQSAHYPIRIL